MQKLALGTVQFGMNYGINNNTGIPKDEDVSNILDFAYKSDINTLDTAIAYGNSQERLGKLSRNNFQIISKFSGIYNFRDLKNELTKSLSHLRIKKLYGFMFHNANDLIENPNMWNFLEKLKSSNKIQKIGFSIYNDIELSKILNFGFVPDIVQLPYSILDRRFENSLIKLKQLGVEIHVRSVFLQGLYFREINSIPKKLNCLKPVLEKLHQICKTNNISMSSLALNFVKQNKNIDKIVIGAESKVQLEDNITVMNKDIDDNILELINKLDVVEKELLNPVNWH
jgi:aryl-alcohol dehydrogenase-like predicted oxidoreductase